MEIIDSHVHIVEENKIGRPWDASYASSGGSGETDPRKALRASMRLTSDSEMLETTTRVGVDGALLVATSHYGWDNSYPVASAAKHPNRFRVVGRLNPDAADIEEQTAEWKANPVAVGLRILMMNDATNEKIAAGHYHRFFIALQRYQIPLCIFPPNYLSHVALLATKYEALSLVIDHLGMPQPHSKGVNSSRFGRLHELMRLAVYPNISVKLSAAPALSTQCYPFEDLWPYIHQVVGAFGPERVMWGSDWTRVAGFVSYDEGIGYIATTDELSKHDKSLILGQSLRRVFGWNR